MSAPALLSPARRRRRAVMPLWVLSNTIAVFSVGLALARLIPPSTPSYVSVLLVTTTLGMNAVGVWLQRSAGPRRRTHAPEWSGWAGLIGPCLTGFAWTGEGAILPIVLTPLLTLLAAAAWLVWTGLEPVGRSVDGIGLGHALPRHAQPPEVQTSAVQEDSTVPNGAMLRSRSDLTEPHPPSAEEPEPDADVIQQIIRRRTAEGEVLEVTAALEFAPDEQRVSLHLPISPALPARPEVECEPWEDGDLELQVGAAYPHGVRIDARRPGDAQAARRAMIAVLIRAVSQQRAA